jgi:hypothetical protein
MASGSRFSERVTLAPGEVEMAHLSYRGVPKAEAERMYAEAKLRLQRERAAGRYPESDRN